jgi:hypothetical protein
MNKIDVAHARLNSIAADDHLGCLESFFDLMIAEAKDALTQDVIKDEEKPLLEDAAREMEFARRCLIAELRQAEQAVGPRLAERLFRAVNAVHLIGMIGNASESAKKHGRREKTRLGGLMTGAKKQLDAVEGWHPEADRLYDDWLKSKPRRIDKAPAARYIRENCRETLLRFLPKNNRSIEDYLKENKEPFKSRPKRQTKATLAS